MLSAIVAIVGAGISAIGRALPGPNQFDPAFAYAGLDAQLQAEQRKNYIILAVAIVLAILAILKKQ